MQLSLKKLAKTNKAFDWVSKSGIMNNAFPMKFENNEFNSFNLEGRLDEISKNHTFYIPVMGTAFTADSPLKVAHYGINTVIALADDVLLERSTGAWSVRLESQ